MYGAFAADSLSLGSHWVYNAEAIRKRLGRPEELTDPIVKTFHPEKKRGEFTHYGDQTLWLLEFIAERGGYEAGAFFAIWKEKMSAYGGYMDHASKETLERGSASAMDDLAGAARTAPLAYLYHDSPETLAEAAAGQALLTHNHPLVEDTARFFSLLLFSTEISMEEALRETLATGGWKSEALEKAVEAGIASAGRDTVEAIGEFGQMCAAERALPGVVHLLVTYRDDYREAMIANTAAGGDSAARGLVAGMVLGARLGEDAVPAEWKEPLVHRERIEAALKRIG